MQRGLTLAHLAGQADLLAEIGGLPKARSSHDVHRVSRHAELTDAHRAGSAASPRRDQMGPRDFAVPGKRALPIHDAKHVRLAWDLIDRTQGLTPAERRAARRRILARAEKLGVDTSEWEQP